MARSSASPSCTIVGSLGRNRVVITDCFSPSAPIWPKNTVPPSAANLPVSSFAPTSAAGALPASASAAKHTAIATDFRTDLPIRHLVPRPSERRHPTPANVALGERLHAGQHGVEQAAGTEPHGV